MAENMNCFWCGGKTVFGYGSILVAPGGQRQVLHETRRACKDHLSLLLDWMDTLQEPPPAADTEAGTPSS